MIKRMKSGMSRKHSLKQQPWDEGCYIKIKLFTHQGGISVLNMLSPNKRTSESMK